MTIAVAAFLAGVVVGWLLSTVKAGPRLSPFLTPASPRGASIITARSVNLTLKCTCGVVHKFHDGTATPAQGVQHIPPGDSFTCPNCGKVHDLKAFRKLAGDVGASI